MPIGPGKYDEALTVARQLCGATGAVLIVFGGENGPGYSCQATLEMMETMPNMLRLMANGIEADLRKDIDQLKGKRT
jgi:hypothetical protein